MDYTYIKKVEALNERLDSIIEVGVRRTDYNVYVYIMGLEERDGCMLSDVSGHGLTYQDACEDYIKNLRKVKQLEYKRCPVFYN